MLVGNFFWIFMVGDRLKQAMKVLGLTQQDVSDSIGISRAYVSQLINEKYQITKTIALALKSEFNLNPTWLLTGEGEMFLAKTYKSIGPASVEDMVNTVEPLDKSQKKINHLTAHNGNVKEYPDIDDSDQIARTAWYRNLPDVNQWIINAMDEIRNDEDLEKIKKILTALVLKQRAEKELNEELQKVYEKIIEKDSVRKKGEAG